MAPPTVRTPAPAVPVPAATAAPAADPADHAEPATTSNERTLVTIVTGFLGSGKTTLVNHILKEQNTWKVCVVENEFGEVAIDGALVEENLASKEDIIMLENGCVCCTVRGDLIKAFENLVSRRKTFDAIILETTGLADPSPIIFTFNSNEILSANYRLDSVVCLVDAKHVGIHLDEVKPDGNINEAERQIAFADRILLNKLDLVTKDELKEVEKRLKSMNSFASIIHTERSIVPLDKIIGLNSFSLSTLIDMDPTIMDDLGEDEDHHHDDESDDGVTLTDNESVSLKRKDPEVSGEGVPMKKKRKTHNLSLVSSVGFTIEGSLHNKRFSSFMGKLLEENAPDYYRTKGILSFTQYGTVKHVFQGVHENINFGPGEISWKVGEPRISKMVFIGKNMDYDFLKAGLQASTAKPKRALVTMHRHK